MIRFALALLAAALALPARASDYGVTNVSGAGLAATASAAAAPNIAYRACKITASISGGPGGVTGTQTVNLRDGASGAGTILWSVVLSAPASSTSAPFTTPDLNLQGTPGNVMTLEFAAGGTNSAIESVSLTFAPGVPCQGAH